MLPKSDSEELEWRCLLTCSDQQQVMILKYQLLQAGFDVEVARSSQEAADKVIRSIQEGDAFDLIMVDQELPKSDGLETLNQIKSCFTSQNSEIMPVYIGLTSYLNKHIENQCLDFGYSALLKTPIN